MGILDRTVTTIFVLLGGIAIVGVATDLGAVVAPDNVRELHAYETAPRCAAASSKPVDCRWTEEFTVSEVHDVPSYKKGDRSADLISASGARWDTEFGQSGPVLSQLDQGDRVTGTIWRGRLTEITADGVTQLTQRAPDDGSGPDILALLLAPSGVLVVVACAGRLRRHRSTRVIESMLGLSVGLLFVGCLSVGALFFLADLLSQSLAGDVWLFAGIFGIGAAWLTISTYRGLKAGRAPDISI